MLALGLFARVCSHYLEGFGTSFESDQPAHLWCLIRLYTAPIHILILVSLKSPLFKFHMVRIKKCHYSPAKENFTLSKNKPGDLLF